ncbi:hypothetical protein EXN32_11845 [Agrobacterium tumefaciens]|uniref:Uncharacterized protein n=2 Tax=Rhizobium/Agrobacterium group TaxID=227290 RepID=A0A2Z2PLG5_RHIRH|nr:MULTISPECIES: hypothetical protein [Rhizobium/Agrobacterium group]ASK42991.1 hypothetical protein [Rhizobium rhizogenes]MCZ7976322.1 hypothetical protein [Agrobacterium salinitolerans]MDA5243210.1 hypothetical protein [Agrobacterium sp. MAFF310724]MDA5247608.1 hypothetical protein [Agrobacterium sp. MAFF210268]TRB03279.1 hypothetical protein EXN61_23460 [Agrobacterium tumefaciens]
MAEIIDFPLERSFSTEQRALIDQMEEEGARFLKATESLLGVLRQAERTQKAILAYQAEIKNRGGGTQQAASRKEGDGSAAGDYRSSTIRYASDD